MDEFFKVLTKTILFFSGSALGGVLGYLLKTQIDHRLAIARNYETIRATEFNKAAATFRTAFVDAIFALRSNIRYGHKNTGNILNESTVILHEKAKIIFEPFVSASELGGFNAAWEKYRYGERNRTEDPDNVAFKKELSQIYLNHIDDLLKYAESKSIT